MPRPSIPGICRYLAQAERLRLWGQDVPSNMRLGWTCNVPYCGKPEHYTLAERRDAHFRDYSDIRARLWQLQEGESFALPEEPNDEKSLIKFACALRVNSPHLLIRSLPRRTGIRIIRYGDWYDGQGTVDYIRAHRIVRLDIRPKAPATECFYLGFMWGVSDPGFPRVPRCRVKACAYPAVCGEVCRQHLKDRHSPPYDRSLDQRDMIAPKEFPMLSVTLYRGSLSEDRRAFLHARTLHNGVFTKKSLREKQNDKWWQKNVIEKGLITDTDGVMHFIESERALNRAPQAGESEYRAAESRRNIEHFFSDEAIDEEFDGPLDRDIDFDEQEY